jgi:hypothetical protein
MQVERERFSTQAQTEMARTAAQIQANKANEEMRLQADLFKQQTDKQHASETQNKQLFAQGLQQAHQMANNNRNKTQPKKGE